MRPPPQVSTNYSREWVENAPVRRFTFFDLINAAPGVSAATSTSSRSQSFGSATNENLYLIDGTDFTAPLTGAAWPWPNTDAIEEIQVLSLGAPADYGNLGGAVFNVVTRQGSNAFRGDANFYFQNQDLTGRNTDRRTGRRPALQPRRVQGHDRAARRADRARTSSGSSARTSTRRTPSRSPAPTRRSRRSSSAKRYFYKLNYQINQDNRLQFQKHDDFYRIPGARHGQHGAEHASAWRTATTPRPASCGRRSSTRRR